MQTYKGSTITTQTPRVHQGGEHVCTSTPQKSRSVDQSGRRLRSTSRAVETDRVRSKKKGSNVADMLDTSPASSQSQRVTTKETRDSLHFEEEIVEEDDAAAGGGAETMQGGGTVSGLVPADRQEGLVSGEVRQIIVDKKVDSQRNIQTVQHYVLGLAGMEINMGKIGKTSQNQDSLLHRYKKQVEGVAEAWWKYQCDPKGGRQGSHWMNNRSAGWMDQRLLHTDNNLQKPIGGKYLWDQWTDGLRSSIDNEVMVTWNFVTTMGLEVSGGDFMTIIDFVMQSWYETSLDRVSKSDAKKIKADNLKKW